MLQHYVLCDVLYNNKCLKDQWPKLKCFLPHTEIISSLKNTDTHIFHSLSLLKNTIQQFN